MDGGVWRYWAARPGPLEASRLHIGHPLPIAGGATADTETLRDRRCRRQEMWVLCQGTHLGVLRWRRLVAGDTHHYVVVHQRNGNLTVGLAWSGDARRQDAGACAGRRGGDRAESGLASTRRLRLDVGDASTVLFARSWTRGVAFADSRAAE